MRSANCACDPEVGFECENCGMMKVIIENHNLKEELKRERDLVDWIFNYHFKDTKMFKSGLDRKTREVINSRKINI
jgi:hypothetical protein